MPTHELPNVLSETLQRAAQLFEQGRHSPASSEVDRVIRADPGNSEAWLYRGRIAQRVGDRTSALEALQKSVDLDPTSAVAQRELGNILLAQGKLATAEECFRISLSLDPMDCRTKTLLGNALRDQGKLDEAIETYLAALEASPVDSFILNNLGVAYARANRLEDAKRIYRSSLEIQPDHAEVHNNLGVAQARSDELEDAIESFDRALRVKPNYADALCNRGIAFKQLNRLDQAEASFRQACSLDARNANAFGSLGSVLLLMNRRDDAVVAFRNSIEINPRHVESLNYLGNLLREQGNYHEAISLLRKAIEFAPDFADAHVNLGIAYARTLNVPAAIRHYNRATNLQPAYVEARVNRALAYLVSGDFEQGWEEYEWRRKLPAFVRPEFDQPRWNGERLEGRRILLVAEQGFGDLYQFVRYARLLKELGAIVVLQCPAEIAPLMRLCPIIDFVAPIGEALPEFDVYVELLSLPLIFKTGLATVPADGPYLEADPQLTENWRARLSGAGDFKVGIVWEGNSHYGEDRQRSIPLAHFSALSGISGVQLFSLQKGASGEQVRELGVDVIDWGHRLDDAAGPFMDTAAIIRSLDLVISCDTSVAHLAGALGKPVWIALPYSPDWRWMLQREDSPWYPLTRLFRQRSVGDWEEVFQRIQSALQDASAKHGAPELHVDSAPGADHNAQGVQLAQAGRLGEAIACFRYAVGADPENPDANNNLGNALRNTGYAEEGLIYLERAVELRRSYAEAWHNLGITYAQLGRREQAIKSFETALEINPNFAPAHISRGTALLRSNCPEDALPQFQQAIRLAPHVLQGYLGAGNALRDLGKKSEAVQALRKAVELGPDHPEALNNLGNTLRETGEIEEAISYLRKAIQVRPDYPEAYNNLGIAFAGKKLWEDAAKNYRKAIEMAGDYAPAYNNLGIALSNLDRPEEAMAAYHRAIEIHPKYPEAWNNLAITQSQQGLAETALRSYAKAIEIRSDYAEAYSNKGIVLTELSKTSEALQCYQRALEIREDYPDARMNRALTYLLTGDFENGWKEYEWRWKCQEFNPRDFSQPRWDGSPLNGSRILLHTEQGFGDTFQFIRYASLVKERGGHVILRCPRPLIHIMKHTLGIDEVCVEGDDLPPFDKHIELLSLPLIFETRLESIPVNVPYIEPDPRINEFWKTELNKTSSYKVGINWQGNPKYRGDRHRSIPLAHFAPIADIEGVQLVSLQKGFGTEQMSQVRFATTQLGVHVDEAAGSFRDTAAIMKNLDLVVTSDTALAHLAGAIGVPVWLALPYSPDWRWLLRRSDSPWYPTMRLFRQHEFGDWESVFREISSELQSVVDQRRSIDAPLAPVSPGELIDKITILRVKESRIKNPEKLVKVQVELDSLQATMDRHVKFDAKLSELTEQLQATNEALWDIEDDIRELEQAQDFGARFIELARSVYRTNDERGEYKRRINDHLGAALAEVKEYHSY